MEAIDLALPKTLMSAVAVDSDSTVYALPTLVNAVGLEYIPSGSFDGTVTVYISLDNTNWSSLKAFTGVTNDYDIQNVSTGWIKAVMTGRAAGNASLIVTPVSA